MLPFGLKEIPCQYAFFSPQSVLILLCYFDTRKVEDKRTSRSVTFKAMRVSTWKIGMPIVLPFKHSIRDVG